MPLILSLETSTDVCSVAFHDGETLLGHVEIHEPQIHAARLIPVINQVSKDAQVDLRQVAAIAVTSGPGSYTGLRIGTSTAKGLCYALDIPLVSVGTLQLLAFQGNVHNTEGAMLCPMIDARRMEVYCMVADRELNIIEPVAARVIDQKSFAELLDTGRVLFFGNGAEKCREVIRHPNAVFLTNIFPMASSLALLAHQKFRAGEVENLVDFQPFYLKEFQVKKAGTPK